jgi:hypothetical protein
MDGTKVDMEEGRRGMEVEVWEGRIGMDAIVDAWEERRGMEAWLRGDEGRVKTEESVPVSLKESRTSCTVMPDITIAEISFSVTFWSSVPPPPSTLTSASFPCAKGTTIEPDTSPTPPDGVMVVAPDDIYFEMVSKLNL